MIQLCDFRGKNWIICNKPCDFISSSTLIIQFNQIVHHTAEDVDDLLLYSLADDWKWLFVCGLKIAIPPVTKYAAKNAWEQVRRDKMQPQHTKQHFCLNNLKVSNVSSTTKVSALWNKKELDNVRNIYTLVDSNEIDCLFSWFGYLESRSFMF